MSKNQYGMVLVESTKPGCDVHGKDGKRRSDWGLVENRRF